MKSYQPNLIVRFILEITTLFIVGYWAWHLTDHWYKYVCAIGIPLSLALIWGIFAVPDDPSRSGKTVVKTPGWIRLIIELLFFGFGSFAFVDFGFYSIAVVFTLLVILHYLFSFARIIWLIKQ